MLKQRVWEQRTDTDKLVIEMETNGTIDHKKRRFVVRQPSTAEQLEAFR